MNNSYLVNQDSGRKTFITPRAIIEALGRFDCDPATPPQMPWRTADVMYTPEDDGLAQPWRGRVWLNPPFGKDAIPFLARMVEHVKNGGSGIVLLFARTDNKAWHEFIFPHAKGIFFMRKRIRFCGLDGVAMSSSPMPSALVAFTWQDVDALQRFSESNEGHLVTL